jgi:hypothetical protein
MGLVGKSVPWPTGVWALAPIINMDKAKVENAILNLNVFEAFMLSP